MTMTQDNITERPASADADLVNDAIVGSAPVMPAAPDTAVQLQIGVLDGERRLMTAHVRELNGYDEEKISAFDAKKVTNADRFAFIVGLGTERLGDTSVDQRPALLDGLTSGDRDLIFLGIIKATYGNTRSFTAECGNPDCGERLDIEIDLDEEFKTRTLDDCKCRPDGTFDVTLRDGRVATFRIPTQGITKEVRETLGDAANDVAKNNTAMIARCLLGVKGGTMPANTHLATEWALGLNLADRKRVVEGLTNVPGPRLGEVRALCEACGGELAISMNWALLLYA